VAVSEAAIKLASCFLCTLASTRCDEIAVEGVIAGLEWNSTTREAVLTLTNSQAGPVQIIVPQTFRDTIRVLRALPTEILTTIRARALHVRHTGEQMPASAAAVLLEPDTLFSITDINYAEYCARHYPLRRMVPSPPNLATLRGTIVHGAFKELLKGTADSREDALTLAIRTYAPDLALRHIAAEELAADAEPHLRALQKWVEHSFHTHQPDRSNVRAETFLLAPQVGLKGRLDFLLTGEEGHALLELKTGRATSTLPKREHRWQVHGYQTLLTARQNAVHALPRATVLYSGTPDTAEGYGVPFIPRDLWRVLDLRNQLAIVHASGWVPHPPSESRCARCSLLPECSRASRLLAWPEPYQADSQHSDAEVDVAWFRTSYEQLHLEGNAAEQEATGLWRKSAGERMADGSAIGDLRISSGPHVTASGEWEYQFTCDNTSELREGDEILLSDGDPIQGEVVTGTILSVQGHTLTLWTPERITHPRMLDRYQNDIVQTRTVRNLWRWLDVDPRLRGLLAGRIAPSFGAGDIAPLPADLNLDQERAIRQALRARDFFLVQGPPGTGKTRVVAEIIMAAVARGERVLLAAFTNQAVDTVLRKLRASGFERFIRLGHALSVSAELHEHLLIPHGAAPAQSDRQAGAQVDPSHLYERLAAAPVVAATTATWSSERYDSVGEALRFDLALVDEASQLTTPAITGALRFAQRFILVGDEQQLPPLVMSEEASRAGLGESPFARLRKQWGSEASATLHTQYRMHPVICGFPGEEFYGGKLVAANSVSSRTMRCEIPRSDPMWPILSPERPAVFIDVPQSDMAGKASLLQAHVAAHTVSALRKAGLRSEQIGVIAPYRAQVAAIRQRLSIQQEQVVTVDTVDRFQGAERDVMLLVLGGRPGSSGSQREDFVADPYRLNVALTRARHKLIIIGHQPAMRQHPRLQRLLTYYARLYGGRGGIITARIAEPAIS